MKHLFVALLVALAAVAWGLPRTAWALDLAEIARKASPSVVRITLYDALGEKMATGTGFFVSEGGQIVTNHHVIKGGARATATLENGKEIAILGVLAQDVDKDVAVLEAEGDGHPALPLGDSAPVKVGDEIAVVGFPLGLSTTLSTGIVSALRTKGFGSDDGAPEHQSWGIQITAAVSPGSSGSPILARSGEVVAVAVGQMTSGQNLNFGVPVEVAKGLLSGLAPGAVPKPLATGVGNRVVLRNLGISAAAVALPFVAVRIFRRRKKPGPRALD
jgi:S1-C subfamily serine protease